MSHESSQRAADFELTLEGAIGPVLRWALRPHAVVDSHTCTTFRAVTDASMCGLVELLDSHGLKIESVCVATPIGTVAAQRRPEGAVALAAESDSSSAPG